MRQAIIKQKIKKASNNVAKTISGYIANSQGNYIARGLSSEGYAGGYRDALEDILLLLNNTTPNRNGYWNDSNTET